MSAVKTPEYGVGSFTLCRPWPCADVLGEVFRGIFIPLLLFPSCVGFHWGQSLCCRKRRWEGQITLQNQYKTMHIQGFPKTHSSTILYITVSFVITNIVKCKKKKNNGTTATLNNNFTSILSFWQSFSPQRQQLNHRERFSIVSMDKTGWWRPLLVLLHTHEVRPISELRGRVRRLWKGWGRGRQAFHCNETEQHVEHTHAHTKWQKIITPVAND